MQHYPDSILNLIRQISRLPGIGEKTAERLALHILRSPGREAEQLAGAIRDLKEKTRLCSRCYSLSDAPVCRICADPHRDATALCVVEQPADMVALEKSGAFRGLYHILGGVLSPMDGIGPDEIRARELLSRLAAEKIAEVVIATSTSVEGEATADYLTSQLARHAIRVTRIASGVPVGGDLKFVDQVTLKRAMEARHDVR
jgi:recombination protein RecR